MKEYRASYIQSVEQERRLKIAETDRKKIEELLSGKSQEKLSENKKFRQAEKNYEKVKCVLDLWIQKMDSITAVQYRTLFLSLLFIDNIEL